MNKIEDIDLGILKNKVRNNLSLQTINYTIIDSVINRCGKNDVVISLKDLKINVDKAIEIFGENELSLITYNKDLIIQEVLDVKESDVDEKINEILKQIKWGLKLIDIQNKQISMLYKIMENYDYTSLEYNAYEYTSDKIKQSRKKIKEQIEEMIDTGIFSVITTKWIIYPKDLLEGEK